MYMIKGKEKKKTDYCCKPISVSITNELVDINQISNQYKTPH